MLCIYDTATGDAVGVPCVRHREAALDALAQSHDYPIFQAWAAASGVRARQFCVIDSNAALTAKGRALYGPTYRGHVWYGEAENAGRLAAAGEPNRYEPHVDVCSPYSRTTEAAALSGFAPGALADVLAHAARTSTTTH